MSSQHVHEHVPVCMTDPVRSSHQMAISQQQVMIEAICPVAAASGDLHITIAYCSAPDWLVTAPDIIN